MSTDDKLQTKNSAACHFSENTRNTIEKWSSSLTTWRQMPPGWKESLSVVASEASFLGHPSLVYLCRALWAALHSLSDEGSSTKPTDEQSEPGRSDIQAIEQNGAFLLAFHTMLNFMENASSTTHIGVQEAINSLAKCFKLSADQLEAPIPMDFARLQSVENLSKFSNLVHIDTPVYRRDSLNPLDHCAEEESWTVSQLATLAEDLSTGLKSDRCAQRLLQLFRNHRFLNRIDRVCLVLRVADTNQLTVVDSCVSQRFGSNLLKKGYSCFVNPQGSLFSLKPGMTRIFAQSSQVLDSFRSRNRPVQRSIAMLASSGVESGVCMAIGRGQTLRGFLFLNSKEPKLFDSITDQYAPLFSLLGLVGTIALDVSGRDEVLANRTWFLNPTLPNYAVPFDKNQFKQFLGQTIESAMSTPLDIDVQCDCSETPFLFLPRLVCQVLHGYLQRIQGHIGAARMLKVSIQTVGRQVRFGFHIGDGISGTALSQILDRFQLNAVEELQYWPIQVSIENGSLVACVPLEPVFDVESPCQYSVVY